MRAEKSLEIGSEGMGNETREEHLKRGFKGDDSWQIRDTRELSWCQGVEFV